MLRRIYFLLFAIYKLSLAQYSLDYFVGKAIENSPVLKEYHHLQTVNQFQQKLNRAENSAFQISLSGDYLFTPYFNNHGHLVTTNPSPQAIGYDINLFDGGLYSAQLNLERNIFNGGLLNIFDQQVRIQDEAICFESDLEKHNLVKQIADQYLTTYQFLLLTHLAQEVVTNLHQQVILTNTLVEKGYTKVQDYLLLKIELETRTVELNDTKEQYRSNLYQLYALCGMQDTMVADIDSISLVMNKVIPTSNFMQKFSLDSLALVNQQNLFETKYLPRLNVFFNTGLNAVELKNMQRKFGLSAGLSMSLPLFDGRQKHLTRQQSLIHQQTISAYRSFSEKNIARQREILVSRITSMQRNIYALNKQISDFQSLLQISEKQLQQGNISMIDHLTLLRNYMEIRKNKINMQINLQLEINNYNYWNW
jgi:outer membrane protein TolC